MNIRTALSLATLAFVSALPARGADVSFDFNGSTDGGLVHYDPLAPFGSGSTFTFPGGDTYRLTSGPSANQDALGPTRVGAYLPGQTFTDFRESVDLVGWNRTLDQDIGLGARLSNIGIGTSNGYFLHYNTNPGFGSEALGIERIDGEVPGPNEFAFLGPLDSTAGYRLVFTGIGSTLTGELFALSDLSNALATVTFVDSTYASGLTGMLVTGVLPRPTNTGVDATFDNFRVQSVPEPGSLFLLGIGAAGVLAWRRRSHHSPFEVS